MENFSTNGECLAVGSRRGFVTRRKRGVVSLALPTGTFLRNKTVPVVMGFSFAENAPKGNIVEKQQLFFRQSAVCSPKYLSLPPLCFPCSSPGWTLSAQLFRPLAALSLPSSSPLPSAFILPRSLLPAMWKRETNILSLSFLCSRGLGNDGKLWLPVHEEGLLMVSTVIRNTGYGPKSVNFSADNPLLPTRMGSWFSQEGFALLCYEAYIMYTNAEIRPFHYRAVFLFEK